MNDVGNDSFNASSNITARISYVKSNGRIYTANEFKGKLINCELDCRGKSTPAINNVGGSNIAIIERCKLLSDSGFTTIDRVSPGTTGAQILYTITNEGINANILPIVSTQYNSDI